MRLMVRLAALTGALALVPAATAAAATQIATDPGTGGAGQHHTIVEPDSFGFGSTIVAAAQAGRVFDGGGDAISWATSTDNGSSWASGLLPGLTKATTPAGSYDRATDASVAYDARHSAWLVSTLGLVNTSSGPTGRAVLTSRSMDGGLHWGNPVTTALASKRQDFDKNWIVCDNSSSSPFYGSCYTQFDDFGSGNALKMYYSRDGGVTWTASRVPRAGVIGGQPLVLKNGNVVVPLDNASSTALGYTISTDGGAKFGSALTITSISASTDPGSIRAGALPTAEIAGDDTIYVAWEDCRFRPNCPGVGTPNDIVYVTSTTGANWSTVKRVPIDATSSTADHFLPGIAVDQASSAPNIHVGLVYYYYPSTACTFANCSLNVGYISSANGGTSWSAPTPALVPAMTMSWLPDTSQGRMVGDYMSASFGSDGNVHPAYVGASAPTSGGSDCSTATPNCAQSLFSNALGVTGGSASAAADSVMFNGTVKSGPSVFKRSR